MRNLAEVCSIKTVETIIHKGQEYTKVKKYTLNENAYEFVAQAGFQENDKVIFIGEGALIPASNSHFEFLRTKCYTPKFNSFRVKPQKMCGLISMGILMPINIVKKDYKIGSDLTELLQIQKYEDIEDASPKKESNWVKSFLFKHFKWLARKIWKSSNDFRAEFPSWIISKTDEDNIENKVAQLEDFKDSPYYYSIKMEGQSFTAILDKDDKFSVCSRNCCFTGRIDNNYWTVVTKYNLEQKLRDIYKKYNMHVAIQGEICGPSIQNNIYNFNTLHLYLFNIKNIDTGEYLDMSTFINICKEFELPSVPILKIGDKLRDFINTDKLNEVRSELVENLAFSPRENDEEPLIFNAKTENKKINNKTIFHHEGIVIRTQDMRFSCKMKSKEYALWFSGK